MDAISHPDSVVGAQAIGNILIGLAVTQMGRQALQRISVNEAQIKKSGEFLA